MGMLMTAGLAAFVVLVTLIHAASEYRDQALARWLADELHFFPRDWLAWPLYVLAGGNILVPLVIALAARSPFVWMIVSGALAGDAILTHLLFFLRRPPGLATTPLQLLGAAAIAWMVGWAGWPFALGVGLFAPLRLILRPLAWLDRGIMSPDQGIYS